MITPLKRALVWVLNFVYPPRAPYPPMSGDPDLEYRHCPSCGAVSEWWEWCVRHDGSIGKRIVPDHYPFSVNNGLCRNCHKPAERRP